MRMIKLRIYGDIDSCFDEKNIKVEVEKERTEEAFTFDEYQRLAARTINKDLSIVEQEDHALHEITSEVGELHGLYQKVYQGHEFDCLHAAKEVGDILWGIAEWCTANGISMGDVAKLNIEKLKARYKDGFSSEESLNRKEGDV